MVSFTVAGGCQGEIETPSAKARWYLSRLPAVVRVKLKLHRLQARWYLKASHTITSDLWYCDFRRYVMKILSAAEMRDVDRLTTERYRIPGIQLMENAATSVVEAT